MSKPHPQQEDDEIYLGHADQSTFDRSIWTTKRLGTSVDHPDNDTPDTFPMFIQKAEVVRRGDEAYFDMGLGEPRQAFKHKRVIEPHSPQPD